MKILILNPFLFTAENGVLPKVKSIKDTMIYNMSLGFKKLGHDVTLVAGEEFKPVEKEGYDCDIMFVKSDFKKIFPPTMLPCSLELRRFLQEHHKEFDMVLSSETFMFPSLFAAMICPEKTVIWHELNCHQHKFHELPSKFWYNVVARMLMRNVLTVVPRSASAQKFISRYMPRVSNAVVEHGINVEKFVATKEKKRQVISSSRLVQNKNVDFIIRKFARLHSSQGYEDVKLIIAGRGEEEDHLRLLASEMRLDNAIEFVGFLPQKELGKYVGQSMASLVNTSRDLNVVSIPESIVCGTPILTNALPSSSGYVASNKLGIVKNDWDETDMKAIIDSNEEYVNNCLAYRDNLTNEHVARMLVDVFRCATHHVG